MNFTIMLLLLMLITIIAAFTKADRREECHNAKSSPQKAPTAPPTPEEETAPAQPDEPTAQPTPEEETAPAQPDEPTAQPTPEEETAPAQPYEPTAQPTPEEETAPSLPIAEAEIRDKIRAGLTRAQAIEVINRQAEHDAMLARTANHGG